MLDLTKPVKVNGDDWGVPKVDTLHPWSPHAWVFPNGRKLSRNNNSGIWECNKMEIVFVVEQDGNKFCNRPLLDTTKWKR